MSVGAMDIARRCAEVEHANRALLEPRDSLGRKQPRRFDALLLARAIPGFIDRFKRVPDGFVEFENGTARVWCTCLKSAPAVQQGGLVSCSRCGRIYMHLSGLWVTRGGSR